MALSIQQAAEALHDVERAQHRAVVLRGYEYGAPHFLLWGSVWVLGYAGTDLLPQQAGLIWLILDALGLLGGYLIVRAAPSTSTTATRGWRFAAVGLCFAAFIGATYYILGARTGNQFGAFPALLMSLLYTLFGLWRGVRWAIVGVALFTLTVTGYVLLREHFMLWMSLCGGGTLLLTGLWMRRA
jgi:hypothetical protein